MELEKKLVAHIVDARMENFPQQDMDIVRNMVLTNVGTIVAGATAEGCQALVGLVEKWGGKKEASILVHGGKVPAHHAVLANARAGPRVRRAQYVHQRRRDGHQPRQVPVVAVAGGLGLQQPVRSAGATAGMAGGGRDHRDPSHRPPAPVSPNPGGDRHGEQLHHPFPNPYRSVPAVFSIG